ncbi:YIEGIA family protein [Mechercharimyces sp. CAU 1602]|uniref:YIEGIA family protein n=1 Tax=Mechercharimyces sp. CAU 1602 TaxID=2973933 RepID=UPI002161B3DB|nr:YIEGIA family protein [Mechercharimyces sp. CAU 1602]MCS1350965.1 YIEGIA family protein [Mechercharimyces sp. CAU 1602]
MDLVLGLSAYTQAVVLGIITGMVVRIRMLRIDYRQYPTYPHGQLIHLSLALIAAALGAIAVPALLERNYTAVTFLTLAAQQFRDVRNMERETLSNLDKMELVPRGASYIEGIAMVFEGRNYLVILTSLITAFAATLASLWVGILVAVFMFAIAGWLRTGKKVEDIAEVVEGKLRVEGASLYVDDIYLMNIGLEDNQQKILHNGIGLIAKPADSSARITLSNLGQRQAILHDSSSILGVYRDTGEPALTPISKRDLDDGRLGILFLPQERNVPKAVQVIRNVPVLESAVHLPNQFP